MSATNEPERLPFRASERLMEFRGMFEGADATGCGCMCLLLAQVPRPLILFCVERNTSLDHD